LPSFFEETQPKILAKNHTEIKGKKGAFKSEVKAQWCLPLPAQFIILIVKPEILHFRISFQTQQLMS